MIAVNYNQTLDSYRKSDAIFIVCQNNSKKTVEIAAANEEARKISGYSNEELVGKPIACILPERIANIIDEFIEYDDNNDLLAVLSKVSEFAIRTKSGKDLEIKLRIIPGEAIDNNPWFHLVLIDKEKLRQDTAFRGILQENFKGHEVINERTGLPDRNSLIKDIELITYYVSDKDISASFAVLDINFYEGLQLEYGKDVCDELHKHIGHICKLKLRPEDTIGSLSDRTIGIIMVNAKQEAARMVLNRLRWAISITPLQLANEELSVQVNVNFTQIDGKISPNELLEKCENYNLAKRVEVSNSVNLVITHERRESDRRNNHENVDKNSRRKDRRKN